MVMEEAGYVMIDVSRHRPRDMPSFSGATLHALKHCIHLVVVVRSGRLKLSNMQMIASESLTGFYRLGRDKDAFHRRSCQRDDPPSSPRTYCTRQLSSQCPLLPQSTVLQSYSHPSSFLANAFLWIIDHPRSWDGAGTAGRDNDSPSVCVPY